MHLSSYNFFQSNIDLSKAIFHLHSSIFPFLYWHYHSITSTHAVYPTLWGFKCSICNCISSAEIKYLYQTYIVEQIGSVFIFLHTLTVYIALLSMYALLSGAIFLSCKGDDFCIACRTGLLPKSLLIFVYVNMTLL